MIQTTKTASRGVGLWGVLLFVVVALLPMARILEGTLGTIWSTSLLLFFLGSAVVGRLRKTYASPVWIFAAYFAAIGVVSSGYSTNNLTSHLQIGAQIVLFFALAPFVLSWYVNEQPKIRSLVVVALFAGQSVSAAAAIGQAAGLTIMDASAGYGRSPGLAGHPNTLGMMAGVAIVIALSLMLQRKGPRGPLLFVLALNAAALLTTGSISALLSAGLGVVVMLLAARVRLRAIVAVIGGSALALWLVTTLAAQISTVRSPLDRILQVTGQTDAAGTWDIRLMTFEYGINSILRDPIYGRGLDDASGVTFDGVTLVHNVLIRAWFQGGFAMALAFGAIYLVLLITVIRSIATGRNALPAAGLTVMAGFALTSASFQQAYFWVLFCALWAMFDFSRTSPEKPAALSADARVDATR